MVLDVTLLAVMLISALLAMVRGFMREVLSIASWAAAAVAALYFHKRLIPVVKDYITTNDTVALAISVVAIFFTTLLVVAVITIKISDTVLDSRIGALDRTLGFLFGLGRGLVIMVVAFVFVTWLVPEKAQPKWISEAKSQLILKKTGEWIVTTVQENVDLEKYFQRRKRPDEQEETPPARSSLGLPPGRLAFADPKSQ